MAEDLARSLGFDHPVLQSEPLCVADFLVEGEFFAVGASPFGSRRIGYVTGGSFRGPRLRGEILPGGGNWSESGRLSDDVALGTFDARVLWRTDDGALIYMTYTGRSAIPDAVSAAFRADPAASESTDHARYYLRIAPVFETADPRYRWLNGLLAVGCGHKTERGIRHSIFAIL